MGSHRIVYCSGTSLKGPPNYRHYNFCNNNKFKLAFERGQPLHKTKIASKLGYLTILVKSWYMMTSGIFSKLSNKTVSNNACAIKNITVQCRVI